MTNEEAIDILSYIKTKLDDSASYAEHDVALNMAIKALEQQSCEDCISRAEALKAIEKEKQGWEGSERYAIDECHSRIAELPSVIPQPKRGKWTCTDDMDEWYGKLFRCSVCGAKVLEVDRYCPYCGAKMEESEDKE